MLIEWINSFFKNANADSVYASELHLACSETGSLEELKKIFENQTDLEVKDSVGRTPLFWAIENGLLDCFEFLLQKGANPNAQDADGVTCLNLAKSSSGLTEFSDLLLQYKADPTLKDKHGKLYLM
jgi:uncharacterized protein